MYDTYFSGLYTEADMRPSTEGLQAIFGKRPFIWQQMALLQLEERLHFEEIYVDDFERFDYVKFASDRFEAWITAKENEKYLEQVYSQKKEHWKDQLKRNLFEPFMEMHSVVYDKTIWDFQNADFSVYSYLGTLGSGMFTALLVLGLQLLVPLVILYNNVLETAGAESNRFNISEEFGFLPSFDLEFFCHFNSDLFERGRADGRLMLVLVLVANLILLIPSFISAIQGDRTIRFRIKSLQRINSLHGKATSSQHIGYMLDHLMSSVYFGFLFAVLMFVLFNTIIISDIILNALAIGFVSKLNRIVAQYSYWDKDKRWIKAGVVELILKNNLHFKYIENRKLLLAAYEIDETQWPEHRTLCNFEKSKRDQEDDYYYTELEIQKRMFKRIFQNMKKKDRPITQRDTPLFDFLDRLLFLFTKNQSRGVFSKLQKYRVWSSWTEVVFLPDLKGKEIEMRNPFGFQP